LRISPDARLVAPLHVESTTLNGGEDETGHP
jgi:hypothetical protein